MILNVSQVDIEATCNTSAKLTPMSQMRSNRGAETLLKRCFAAFERWRDTFHSFMCEVYQLKKGFGSS